MPHRKPAALALLTATAALLSPAAAAHADTAPDGGRAPYAQTAPGAGAGPRAVFGETPASAHGRVVAREGLTLRDAPRRAGTEVGRRPYGDSVAIHCAMLGERVHGEDRWYLLTDGTWVATPSRSIETDGVPRPC
ncbi:hypothetical protein ABZV64_27820 [Streptomyces sp. NPDC004959]|uniref:hypothetical protein n=1 Tax=unclassified Streptomyces TaxID=2593676 RepID=UPI0004C676CB|nr:hypothetical protein [Streptomyces sp. NRRL F-5630]